MTKEKMKLNVIYIDEKGVEKQWQTLWPCPEIRYWNDIDSATYEIEQSTVYVLHSYHSEDRWDTLRPRMEDECKDKRSFFLLVSANAEKYDTSPDALRHRSKIRFPANEPLGNLREPFQRLISSLESEACSPDWYCDDTQKRLEKIWKDWENSESLDVPMNVHTTMAQTNVVLASQELIKCRDTLRRLIDNYELTLKSDKNNIEELKDIQKTSVWLKRISAIAKTMDVEVLSQMLGEAENKRIQCLIKYILSGDQIEPNQAKELKNWLHSFNN